MGLFDFIKKNKNNEQQNSEESSSDESQALKEVADSEFISEAEMLSTISYDENENSDDINSDDTENSENTENSGDSENSENTEKSENNSQEPEKKKINIKELISTVPKKVLILIIALVLLLVGATGTLVYFKMKVKKTIEEQIAKENEYLSNAPRYIYLYQEKEIGGKKIMLSKILPGKLETLFFFENYLDMNEYDAKLLDGSGNRYNLDRSFFDNQDKSNTILHFEPIDLSAQKLSLTLYSKTPPDNAVFEIIFSQSLESTKGKFLNNSLPASTEIIEPKIEITNADFTATGSTISYLIKSVDDDIIIRHKEPDDNAHNDYLIVEEGAKPLLKYKTVPDEYRFNAGKDILGKLDFLEVRNLNSELNLIFKNLYAYAEPFKEIKVGSLFGYLSKNNRVKFDFSHYTIWFEGLKLFDDQFILTYHVVDKKVIIPVGDETTGRVETIIECDLISRDGVGQNIALSGKALTSVRGGDIIFEAGDLKDIVSVRGEDTYSLLIKTLTIKLPDVKVKLPLKELSDTKSLNECEIAVKSAFEKRFFDRSDNSQMSDDVLNDETLNKTYKFMQVLEESKYSVNIISMSDYGDYCHAYVGETYSGVNEGKEFNVYLKHFVKLTKSQGIKIIEDKIIK